MRCGGAHGPIASSRARLTLILQLAVSAFNSMYRLCANIDSIADTCGTLELPKRTLVAGEPAITGLLWPQTFHATAWPLASQLLKPQAKYIKD